MKKYLVLVDRALHGEILAVAGDTVFDATGPTYGLVSDDEAVTGIPHCMVTKTPDQWAGAFTIPRGFLREVQ